MLRKPAAKWIINLVIVAFGVYALFLYFHKESSLNMLCHEDGIIEWLTAILYFAAAFIFIAAGKKQGFKNIWYWGLGLLFLVIAGEEISWGQRLLGFATPETLKSINVQQETSFHNIEGIHGNIRGLGLIFILGLCYLIPITDRLVGGLRRFYRKMRIPLYPLWALGIPTIGILFMAIPRLVFQEIVFNLDELGEVYLALGFFLFSISEKNSQT